MRESIHRLTSEHFRDGTMRSSIHQQIRGAAHQIVPVKRLTEALS